ncbi:MAG: ABC transporter [Gemmatimonadaceae bacterium]
MGARRASFDVAPAAACGITTTVNLELMASGQAIGTVAASNDATDLTVVITTDLQSEWRLRESHLNAGATVGGIPLLPNGSPRLLAFGYHAMHNPRVSSYTFVVPLAAVGGTPGQDLVIAAISLVNRGTTTGVAYGDGPQINPPVLHEYFIHPVQRCGSPPPPPPGKDIVVFNDINVFDAGAMPNPNNVLLVQNLVNYATSGPRGANTEVVWDRGRLARCGTAGNNECNNSNMGIARSTITGAGFTMVDIFSSAGTLDDLLASQGANWKEIWLWTPLEAFDVNEVNALKQFADEGGRVIFIGEWAGYYPPNGIALENQFLLDMGAVMTNTGGAVNCGYNTLPAASLRAHQITTGLTNLTMACSSVLLPGPSDFPLYLDLGNTQVLSAVASIDVTPISFSRQRATPVSINAVPSGLRNTSTGR